MIRRSWHFAVFIVILLLVWLLFTVTSVLRTHVNGVIHILFLVYVDIEIEIDIQFEFI